MRGKALGGVGGGLGMKERNEKQKRAERMSVTKKNRDIIDPWRGENYGEIGDDRVALSRKTVG